MSLLGNKLSGDIAWTMGSFGILAASGVLINVTIASFRDAGALGVFNLAFAVLIVASQLAAFGLHYSVMRHTALHHDDERQRGRLLVTAAVAALLLGVVCAGLVHASSPLLGRLFASPETGKAIGNIAFGLLLFPLNKVLLGYLNGLREMRAFALLQSIRYIVIMVWVAAISASSLPFELSTLAFLVAEVVTTSAVVAYVWWSGLVRHPALDAAWLKTHLAFGGKSLLAGMFVELNSRVDVLMIGYFMTEREVGIYSFAAMLVEGLYQILAVVRTNLNPVLVASLRDRNWSEARHLRNMTLRYIYPLTTLMALALVAGFWVLSAWLIPAKGLQAGLAALAILMVGLTLVSVFVPFDNLLLVSGYPGYQTLQHLAIVATNIVLNAAFIPLLGIEGAALATALSYLAGVAVMTALVNRLLNWNLMTNLVAG